MATYDIEKVTLPNGDVCQLKDASAPEIYTGTTEPPQNIGKVGDLYIQTES